MIIVILFVGLYILGVWACREAFIEDMRQASYDLNYGFFEIVTCFLPIAHWVLAIDIWLHTQNIENKKRALSKKFFKE